MVKHLVLILLAVVSARPTPGMEKVLKPQAEKASQTPYKTLWFQEDLDHINRDPGSINIRVLKVLSGVTNPTGPLLIYTGNEGPIDAFYNMTGFLTDVLPTTLNSDVYFIEHRYYGQSQPKPFTWQYLNTDQVLYDYADIIQQLRPSNYTPVIVFGGSYGGMLAAWMRMKYPHIVDGAIASSAPVLMGLDGGDGYATNVTQVLNILSPVCPTLIQKAFTYLNYMQPHSGYYPMLSNLFRPCDDFTTSQDITNLMNWLVNGIQSAVQSNYPGPSDVDWPMQSWPANVTCQYFSNYSQSTNQNVWELINTTANAVASIYDPYNQQTCFDISSDSANIDQTWTYQTCTELWYPMGTNNITDCFPPNPWNAQDFVNYCKATYGVIPNPQWLKINYGMSANFQKALKYASNIAFMNGAMDPYRYGCIQNVYGNPKLYTHVIGGGAHHTDLRAPTQWDTPDIQAARQTEIALIKQWVAEKQALLQVVTEVYE